LSGLPDRQTVAARPSDDVGIRLGVDAGRYRYRLAPQFFMAYHLSSMRISISCLTRSKLSA